MKKRRLTPFSGSLFRLALGMISGVAVLAAIFTVVDWAPSRRSTDSFDNSPVANLSAGDQRFLEHAAALQRDELELAELALRQATDLRVRDFLARVRADQRRWSDDLSRLTAERGVTSKTERGRAAELARETPRNFDALLLARVIETEAEAIDLFERAATQCEDPALRAFAVKSLPAFQARHAQAKQLRKVIG